MDVQEFAGLGIKRGVVELVTGAFLDGFLLDGSEEFEGWAARERDRLAAMVAGALERLAVAREAAGDDRGAVDVWRRLSQEDPYNSRVVVCLARALERCGERGAALQAAQAHTVFLRKDLGLHAPADVRQVIASLQAPPPESDEPRAEPEPGATVAPFLAAPGLLATWMMVNPEAHTTFSAG